MTAKRVKARLEGETRAAMERNRVNRRLTAERDDWQRKATNAANEAQRMAAYAQRLTAERDRLAEAVQDTVDWIKTIVPIPTCGATHQLGILQAALSSLSAPEQPPEAAEDLVLTEAKAWSDATAALAEAKAELEQAWAKAESEGVDATYWYGEAARLTDELAEAKKCIETLEALRPHWAQGYSSDSIAAQTTIVALSGLWKLLNVDNQTSAVAELHRLTAERDRLAEALRLANDWLPCVEPHLRDGENFKRDPIRDALFPDAALAPPEQPAEPSEAESRP